MGTLQRAHAKRPCLLLSKSLCIVTWAQLRSTNKKQGTKEKDKLHPAGNFPSLKSIIKLSTFKQEGGKKKNNTPFHAFKKKERSFYLKNNSKVIPKTKAFKLNHIGFIPAWLQCKHNPLLCSLNFQNWKKLIKVLAYKARGEEHLECKAQPEPPSIPQTSGCGICKCPPGTDSYTNTA